MSQGTSNTLAHTGWSGFGSGIDLGKASKGDSNNPFYPGASNGPRSGGDLGSSNSYAAARKAADQDLTFKSIEDSQPSLNPRVEW